ncbi:hypothetical protein K461DRAFT_269944 [Myriangium duriaei CBS 260.36]|uniref:SEC7 domain-containing protein n=1 Tax=Myriangium duriaei CBS 260.36 TaxID=1168546 RepID=A0A9P4IXR3_9PEZI|nr:hypothetical protein K461DRAFT_269944 [Myriangium duriaei CBS 260.36]
MPLLSRRRSTLDLLTQGLRPNHFSDDKPDAQSEGRAPNTPYAGLPRSHSDHALRSSPPAYGGDGAGSPVLGVAKPARRFTNRLSRHFSDSHLSAKARIEAESDQKPPPPVPAIPTEIPTPTIMTTAPTVDFSTQETSKKKKNRGNLFRRQKSLVGSINSIDSDKARSPDKEQPKSVFSWGRKSIDTRRNPSRLSVSQDPDEGSSPRPSDASLAPPVLRERKSGENQRGTSPKPKKSSLFNLSKRDKDKRKSLFPLPMKIDPPPQYPDTAPATPRESTSGRSHRSAGSPTRRGSPAKADVDPVIPDSSSLRTSASHAGLGKGNVSFAPPHPLLRNDSNRSTHSTHSSPVTGQSFRLGIRDRASTNSTFGRPSDDVTPPTPPTLNGSTRNSTSTSGRASLGGFLTLNRFRTDGTGFSPGTNSKSNSITISRDTIALPERAEGETAAKYLERLQGLASRNVIAGMLSKSSDPFFQNVLRSYTRRFAFFGEPIDMSLRKFLLEAELPKETQQVDRVIQAFADRYHECNPGIFMAPDQAYIIAFSLMMLHTDAFNKNNKYKMQKGDYIKNTRGQHVSEDILACFYDNICYTPFIHFDEDDFDASSDRLSSFKNKKAKLKGAMPDPVKKSSGPVDPYSLIIDNKLDVLRPSIRDSIIVDDPYNYLGTAKSLDHNKIQRAFQLGGVLQIISARSRPAAFESQATRENPEDAKPGVVDIQVTKVGILWRKSTKRKKARSPWQEWGAILTGSQLYFFKNVSWVKSLMQQYNSHQKHMVPPSPVVFNPPLEDFKPDSHLKIDDAVALVDATYNRHKNAFTLVRHGGEEEILLADNEAELNEWLSLINYAAAFRSAGVRIRAFIGIKDLETPPPLLRRLISSRTGTPTGDHQRHASTSPLLAKQIMAARRKQMISKIAEAEIKIDDTNKQLDTMLRDARHVLLLAPIQPRTREVVIHSAARMDAMLKWTRRDLLRTKCYKDILYMDALEDSDEVKDEAAKMRPISIYPTDQPTVDGAEEELEVVTASPTALSRPLSSTVPAPDGEVFKTPPESSRSNGEQTYSWTLPPLELSRQLNADQSIERHHSVSSAVPSTASLRRPSYTQVSSTSSVNELSRIASSNTNGEKRLSISESNTPNPTTPTSVSRQQRDPLVQSLTATTTSSTRPSSDTVQAAILSTTPESAPRTRSHRKSLHRTLRDGLHESGSIHRHRKGKESASTVKSDGTQESGDAPEGTPGLERQEGRFLLHGKQASVITFGEGWNAGEIRMPVRREDSKRSISDGAHGLAPHDISNHNGETGSARSSSRTPTVAPSVDAAEPHAHESRTQSISSDARVAAAYVANPLASASASASTSTSASLHIQIPTSEGDEDDDDDDDDDERSASYFDARGGDTPDKRISLLDEKFGTPRSGTPKGNKDGHEDVATAVRQRIATEELRKLAEGETEEEDMQTPRIG